MTYKTILDIKSFHKQTTWFQPEKSA